MRRRRAGAFRSRTATRTSPPTSARASRAAAPRARRCSATAPRGSFTDAREDGAGGLDSSTVRRFRGPMIFNTFEYYLLFLFPAAIMFKLAARAMRPWVLIVSAGAFYIHFSLNGFGGRAGAGCLPIFLGGGRLPRL